MERIPAVKLVQRNEACDVDMEGIKTYPNTKSFILNTLYDIIELQRGELLLCDTREGKLLYSLTMYDYVWQLLYAITEMGQSKCEVSISVMGERQNIKRVIRRQFSLLDMMLGGGVEVRIIDS